MRESEVLENRSKISQSIVKPHTSRTAIRDLGKVTVGVTLEAAQEVFREYQRQTVQSPLTDNKFVLNVAYRATFSVFANPILDSRKRHFWEGRQYKFNSRTNQFLVENQLPRNPHVPVLD